MRLVERDDAFEQLRNTFEITRSRKKGHITLVEGAGGTGKTALLRAFSDQAARQGAVILSAFCSRMDKAVSLGVLTQLP